MATAADIRRDKWKSTDCTGQQSIMGWKWSRTRVPLAHCPSIPMTHSSGPNSFTCPYIYTSVHQLLRSSISCVHSSSHVSSPLSGPSIYSRPCHSSINPAIHQTVFFTRFGQPAIVSGSELSICCFFNKRVLQTSVGSSACLITHLSTTVLFTPSLTALLHIWDERRKLRLHPSISDPAITDLITQSLLPTLYSPAFLFATCQKPLITESAARHGCEYQSAFSWSLIHLIRTVCGSLTQRLVEYRQMLLHLRASALISRASECSRSQRLAFCFFFCFLLTFSFITQTSEKHIRTLNSRFKRTELNQVGDMTTVPVR